MNAALATSETVLRVPLERLHPSPTNPRKHLGDLTELAASIAQVGVLEPLVARPAGGDFEIAFGHRRHAAAMKAGIEDVPVIVRDYSDDEVLEAQITENSQREDPHPLDEADGYAALLERNYTVQRIADRIGRPVPYVAQRLKLCGLSKECRAAIDDERISIGVALLLAKLPNQKLQEEGLKSVTSYRVGDGQMPVAEARTTLESEVMCALKGAPFKADDAVLVPAVGACTVCPKRTGVQVDLFADASSPDLCTDPKCFRSKVDAVWQIRSKEHKAAGGEVLNQKDAGKLLGHVWDSETAALRNRFAKLDDKKHLAGKTRTVRSLLGKELPPITLARDPESGTIVELVSKKDVDAAERKATGEAKAAGKPQRDTPSAAEKRQREKELALGEAQRRLLASIVSQVEKRTEWSGVEIGVLQGLVLCARTAIWSEFERKAIKRRGWDKEAEAERVAAKRSNPGDVFEQRVLSSSKAVLAGLLVELLIGRELPGKNREEADTGAALICMALGVSYEKELEAVQKERAGKTESNKPPAQAKADKSAEAKKPVPEAKKKAKQQKNG
jgi:ParB/RepB/Spo0J family partition protein